jgi:signal transduction histidine kinase
MTRQASREGYERAPGLISRIAGTSSLLQPYIPGRRPMAHTRTPAHARNLAAQTWSMTTDASETSAHELAALLERLAAAPELDGALPLIATELPRALGLARVVVAVDEPHVAVDSNVPMQPEQGHTPPLTVARVTRPLRLLPRRPAATGETLETPIEASRERLGLLRAWMAPGDVRAPNALLVHLRIVCTALGQQIMLSRLRSLHGAVPVGRDTSSPALAPDERQRWNALLGYVAQEVQTPLTCIQGHGQLLRRYARAARATTKARRGTLARLLDDCERHLPGLEKHVARIDQLLRDMLDLIQSADGGPALVPLRVDLAALITGVAQRLSAEGASAILVDAPDAVRVACDKARIERVVDELLRYMLRGDRERQVRVQVTQSARDSAPDGAPVARVVIASPHVAAQEMPESKQPATARFGTNSAASQPDPRLAMSAAILRLHGGSLHVTPGEEGDGGIVLQLPLLETHATETGETHEVPNPHRG